MRGSANVLTVASSILPSQIVAAIALRLAKQQHFD
jgi:hypothetical protein